MKNQNEDNHSIENGHNKTDKRKELLRFDDDEIAFVPVENIRIIEQVISNLEEIKRLLNSKHSNPQIIENY